MDLNWVKLNGTSFDARVAISEYEENFNVLDGENAGRVMTGRMIRDIIGTYIGHKVTFFNTGNNEAFDELWDFLIEHSVDDSIMLEAVDGQKQISYEAYYTSGTRKLHSATKDSAKWGSITINFIPMEAQVTP